MPMPSSTTPISCGVDGSSRTPVSSAAPATAPVAAPPTMLTASSGTKAAMTLRNTMRCSSTIAPSTSAPTTVDLVFPSSAVSTDSGSAPVNPVRRPSPANSARVASRKAR